MSGKVIAVDFDGTLCYSRYPGLGEPNTPLIRKLIELQERGSKIVLWTCREGGLLDDAVHFCALHGLKFDAVNENLPEVIERWGNDSRKVSCDIYIDDRSMAPGSAAYEDWLK